MQDERRRRYGQHLRKNQPSTEDEAINVLLDLLPIDIMALYNAACAAIRLRIAS